MTRQWFYAEPGTVITDAPVFELVPGSKVKLACSICGDTGYDVSSWPHPRSWMNRCKRGHGACTGCGRVMKLTATGKIRGHGSCPGRYEAS